MRPSLRNPCLPLPATPARPRRGTPSLPRPPAAFAHRAGTPGSPPLRPPADPPPAGRLPPLDWSPAGCTARWPAWQEWVLGFDGRAAARRPLHAEGVRGGVPGRPVLEEAEAEAGPAGRSARSEEATASLAPRSARCVQECRVMICFATGVLWVARIVTGLRARAPPMA